MLYTSDEHGWVEPAKNDAQIQGGAPELLARWIRDEGHCPRPMPRWAPPHGAVPPAFEAEPLAPSRDCDGTLALSGGDNWTGPALSSFYDGVPMALSMARMGYAASAFGNHELDFGRDAFVQNAAIEGIPYVSANVRVVDPKLSLGLVPFATFQRRGVTIAVVGATTETALTTARASHFAGLSIDPIERSLEEAIPSAWAAGASAVVLLAHECPPVIEPMIERHPEWNLAFVGAGHCHRVMTSNVGATPLVSPGWRLGSYARVGLTIDPSRTPKARVTRAEAKVIDVAHDATGAVAADPDLVQLRVAYEASVQKDLGEIIGFSASGLAHRSEALGDLVTRAWREELDADVAFVNRGGLRQEVPKGDVTTGCVYSVMPFDNRLFVLHLTGQDLVDNLEAHELFAAGVSKTDDGWVDASGAPIDPSRSYKVVTIDFLYFGGSGLHLEAEDPHGLDTGVDWREPLIRWIKGKRTSKSRPLETLLGP